MTRSGMIWLAGVGCCIAVMLPAIAHPQVLGLSVEELSQEADSGETISDGVLVANTDDWPATFFITGSKRCTATLVGDAVLLTAAHCTWAATGKVPFRIRGKPFDADCQASSKYQSWSVGGRVAASNDYALCRVTPSVPKNLGFRFERIRARTEQPGIAAEVHILGFGCTDDYQLTPKGNLTIASVRVAAVPANDNFLVVGKQATSNAPKSAALCEGDSGGAAYVSTGTTVGQRQVVGVAARADQVAGQLTGVSYLASLQTADALAFMAEWQRTTRDRHKLGKDDLLICGIDPKAASCAD